MNQFYNVSDDTHNNEANTNSLGYLDELALVRLCAPVDKLHAILQEFLRNIGNLFELVGHFEKGFAVRVELDGGEEVGVLQFSE